MTDTPRRPSAAAPERIAALASLPMFHKLSGKRVVLVGGTEGALWKAELLAAAGARVLTLLEEENPAFRALAAEIATRTAAGFGAIEIAIRAVTPQDFTGAVLAIADLEDEAEAMAFRTMGRAAGVLVNIVDKPMLCDLQFGSIVNRSPLLVAISTDGAAPVLGQAIRTKIEALLPPGIKRWAELAQAFRPRVQQRELPFSARRSFWQKFTARALASAAAGPDAAIERELLDDLAGTEAEDRRGRVTLVGAGPGDPELLTLKAMRALQGAEVILFDDLVSTEVLDLARREATRISVGKVGHGPSVTQAEINRLIVDHAMAGRNVVRLKSGDPLVFGRAGEEIAACHAAGIAVSVIPGITAAQGAAASLGVSLTDRTHANRVQFVTGHDKKGGLPDAIRWAAIADPSTTTVVYMPRHTLPDFSATAIAAGLSPETPAAAITSASQTNETRIFGTIADLPSKLNGLTFDGPTLVIIGHVLARVAR